MIKRPSYPPIGDDAPIGDRQSAALEIACPAGVDVLRETSDRGCGAGVHAVEVPDW